MKDCEYRQKHPLGWLKLVCDCTIKVSSGVHKYSFQLKCEVSVFLLATGSTLLLLFIIIVCSIISCQLKKNVLLPCETGLRPSVHLSRVSVSACNLESNQGPSHENFATVHSSSLLHQKMPFYKLTVCQSFQAKVKFYSRYS